MLIPFKLALIQCQANVQQLRSTGGVCAGNCGMFIEGKGCAATSQEFDEAYESIRTTNNCLACGVYYKPRTSSTFSTPLLVSLTNDIFYQGDALSNLIMYPGARQQERLITQGRHRNILKPKLEFSGKPSLSLSYHQNKFKVGVAQFEYNRLLLLAHFPSLCCVQLLMGDQMCRYIKYSSGMYIQMARK